MLALSGFLLLAAAPATPAWDGAETCFHRNCKYSKTKNLFVSDICHFMESLLRNTSRSTFESLMRGTLLEGSKISEKVRFREFEEFDQFDMSLN